MAYDHNNKMCGTCAYWIGRRSFVAFNQIDFAYNTSGECGNPSSAIIGGGYASNRGACSSWKSLF